MKSKLLISAAAVALIAGTGFASAQTMPERSQAPSAAPKAQMQGESRGGAELRGTTGQAAPAEKALPRASDKPAATTGQAPVSNEMKGSADTKGEIKGDMKGRADTKSDMRTGTQTKSDMKTDTQKSDTRAGTQTRSTTETTTGQGAAGSRGAVNLSTEQRTKISTSIKQVNVRPVTNVNFSISIGTRVPRTVHLYPLPATVIEVYPDWRGYQFVLVGDEIVIVNPRTFEIVAVIEA
jgi:hypothetical protein